MVKIYLNKFFLLLSLLFSLLSFSYKSYTNYYVNITDATRSLDVNDKEKAKQYMLEFKKNLEKDEESYKFSNTKIILSKLNDLDNLNKELLKEITIDLLSLEKEANPIDIKNVENKFKNNFLPFLNKMGDSIKNENIETIKSVYKELDRAWTRNESFIRNNNRAYYGKIETTLAFLRANIETVPFNRDETYLTFNDLKLYINNYLNGKEINEKSENIDLKGAIDILVKAKEQFNNNNLNEAKLNIKKFIEIWPSVEGEVQTRNTSLYTKIETELPVIMVKGDYQKLDNIVNDLLKIDTTSEYTLIDASLILLREGLEALVIIIALVSSMNAIGYKKGIKYVWGGAILGIFTSIVMSFILTNLFPSISSATNREILEGLVGIVAVFVMISVGLWLHSKSNIKSWNEYINKNIDKAINSGSFISIFSLSFLAVFREGAETILFYTGIIPFITMKNLIFGLLLAFLVLIIVGLILIFATNKIKLHNLFFILTYLIYILSFKMLGVSIHMLQVIGYIPLTIINNFPTIEFLGIYANYQVIFSQVLLLLVLFGMNIFMKKQKN